ncbi:hypothetical protein SESBI_03675 [Sesbania bispinosa]|nr:hypothetical protein SESBI_03675 [Sesbania bispinosa]
MEGSRPLISCTVKPAIPAQHSMRAASLDSQRADFAQSHKEAIRVQHPLAHPEPLDLPRGASKPSARSTIRVQGAASQGQVVSHSRAPSKASSPPSISCEKAAARPSQHSSHAKLPSPLDSRHLSTRSSGPPIQILKYPHTTTRSGPSKEQSQPSPGSIIRDTTSTPNLEDKVSSKGGGNDTELGSSKPKRETQKPFWMKDYF